MKITSAEYQDLLDDDDLHPMTRASFEHGLRLAVNREGLAEKVTEEGLRQRRVFDRQRKALRELRFVSGLQYEASAWRDRKVNPVRGPLLDSVDHAILHKQRGIVERLVRARAEAAAGCVMQMNWLKDHAELIAAVENYRRQ